MKIIDAKQGSLEWRDARLGIATASEMDALISPKGEIRTGDMPATYLAKKLAERWRGEPADDDFWSQAMEQGSLREGEAIPWFELRYEREIRRVGFITTDDGSAGCSPDGLFADDTGIEVKCPKPYTHVSWLIGGKLPKDHVAQVQGSMLVTGAPHWTFFSYARRLPPLVVTVERDEKFIASLSEALAAFNERLADGWARLVEMNGGEPKLIPHKTGGKAKEERDAMWSTHL